MSSALINQATAMSSGKVQQQIQTAVLKQAMDQQKTQGEALVRMIQSTPGAPGSILDIRV
jgi:hypothetical protein